MTSTTKRFYDSVSGFYDDMIGFADSLTNRIEAYRRIISPEIKHAADLGCGTGLDSIALSKFGIGVTGFDISPEMVLTARKNALRYKSTARFVTALLDKINKKNYGKFDLVVSMGNTLANLDRKTLRKSIKAAFKMLTRNGKIMIQVLNYHKIVSGNNRIVKVSTIPGGTVLRFHDFHSNYINFNILKLSADQVSEYKLVTTKIFPYDKDDLRCILMDSGFERIKFYGSLTLEKFSSVRSNDLVIMARKP